MGRNIDICSQFVKNLKLEASVWQDTLDETSLINYAISHKDRKNGYLIKGKGLTLDDACHECVIQLNKILHGF